MLKKELSTSQVLTKKSVERHLRSIATQKLWQQISASNTFQTQILEPVALEKMQASIERVTSNPDLTCIQEVLGNCASCPVALLAVNLVRWLSLSPEHAQRVVTPHCQRLAHLGKTTPTIGHLQNTTAFSGFGHDRKENWQG